MMSFSWMTYTFPLETDNLRTTNVVGEKQWMLSEPTVAKKPLTCGAISSRATQG